MSARDAEKVSSMFNIDEGADNNLKVSHNSDKMSQNTEKQSITTVLIADITSNSTTDTLPLISTDTLPLISTDTLPCINNFNNHFSNTVEESLLSVVESSGS
jgi:hypothetical protein